MSYTIHFEGCTYPPGTQVEAEQLVRSALEDRIGGPAAVEELCRQAQALADSQRSLADYEQKILEDWGDAMNAVVEKLDELWDMREPPCPGAVGGRVWIDLK